MSATESRFDFAAARRRSMLMLAAGIIAIAAIGAMDHAGWLLVNSADDMRAYHGARTTVQRVIDGDTVEVAIPDALVDRAATRVVLWGIDCPEPERSGAPAEPLATEATAFTASALAGQTFTLWLESHQTRDAFGRVLAHLELSDSTRLNELLLEAGLARINDRSPHSMMTRYAQAETNARRKVVGVWNRAND